MKDLEDLGFLNKTFEIRLKSEFMPWLFNNVISELKKDDIIQNDAKLLFKDIQKGVLQQHKNSFIERENALIENKKNQVLDKEVKFNFIIDILNFFVSEKLKRKKYNMNYN